jgi:RNA polymerase sigma-70 factor, ECF subfamily
MENLEIVDSPHTCRDDALVARHCSGDPYAFDELVAIHLDRIFALACEMLPHREDAEEVTQEVLIRLYQELNGARPPKRLRPWLYRVCMNKCIDRQRAGKSRPASLELYDTVEMGKGDDPAEKVLTMSLQTSVKKALSGLSYQQRMAFSLCHFAELSVDEAAVILKCAPATVRVHLSRATAHLRSVLSREEV